MNLIQRFFDIFKSIICLLRGEQINVCTRRKKYVKKQRSFICGKLGEQRTHNGRLAIADSHLMPSIRLLYSILCQFSIGNRFEMNDHLWNQSCEVCYNLADICYKEERKSNKSIGKNLSWSNHDFFPVQLFTFEKHICDISTFAFTPSWHVIFFSYTTNKRVLRWRRFENVEAII